jgi:hypothetical protein
MLHPSKLPTSLINQSWLGCPGSEISNQFLKELVDLKNFSGKLFRLEF